MSSSNSTTDLTPAPVHFTLRAPIIEMGRTVSALRKAALRIGFNDVGPPADLVGEDCAVVNKDPLAGLKVHARGFLVAPGGVISFMPIEINGFTVELPNGLPFHIGLCRYPERIEVQNRSLPTKIRCAQWMSFVRTVKTNQCKRPDECVESHIKALTLLREAERLGVLISITDPYQQWSRPDRRVFERICAEQKELDCAH